MADKLFSLSAVHTVLRNNTEEDDNIARKYIATYTISTISQCCFSLASEEYF